jgi:hypothetical protein
VLTGLYLGLALSGLVIAAVLLWDRVVRPVRALDDQPAPERPGDDAQWALWLRTSPDELLAELATRRATAPDLEMTMGSTCTCRGGGWASTACPVHGVDSHEPDVPDREERGQAAREAAGIELPEDNR